jgi:hypothetical protein
MAVQYSRAGTANWAKVANNINSQDFSFSLGTSPDGAVFLAGTTRGTLTFDTLSISHPAAGSTLGYSWVARLSGAAVMVASPVVKSQFISVYPNPAMESITLQLGAPANQVQVLDLLGRICLQTRPVTGEKLTLSLISLPAGTYFIRVTDVLGSHTARFCKFE